MNLQHTRKHNKKVDTTFAAMAASYSLGVFNDNFFKQAALLLAIGAGLPQLQGTATVIFALPFILCSAYAGWLSDRFPKKNIVVHAKILELVAMLIGACGILFTNWACILIMIFLMGLQSAIFAPALNGSIPEHFPARVVTSVNGKLKMFTTLAILTGITFAGIALDLQQQSLGMTTFGQVVIAGILICVSLIGLFSSMKLTKYQAAAPNKSFPWAGPFHSLKNLAELRRDPLLLSAVFCYAAFYFLAALVVLIINTYGIEQLGLSQTVTSLMSVALMIGVALGAIVASRKADSSSWITVVTPGGLGMALGLITAALSAHMPGIYATIALFASFTFTGFSGGYYLIPITSFIQIRPDESEKGQVLALVGFCSFSGILLAGQLYTILADMIQPGFMLLLAGGVTLVASLLFKCIQQQGTIILAKGLHLLMNKLLRLRYDIEITGLDRIKKSSNSKGILFLPNHPAWIDPVIMMSTLYSDFKPRPLADFDQTNAWYIRPLMRLIGAIRIPKLASGRRSAKDTIQQAIDSISGGLRCGHNVILYPAGKLYRSKFEELGAKSAVHTIIGHNPHQRIVLARTSGLWGSSFSWADGAPNLSKSWKTYFIFILANLIFFGPRRKVTLEFTEPVDFPYSGDRAAINQYLEDYYNTGALPNTQVPYLWWQGRKPVVVEEPEKYAAHHDLSDVPTSIKEQVICHLQEISGISDIKAKDTLSHDLGMDSLSIMELGVWLENQFGIPVENLDSLHTVGDLMLVACGQNMHMVDQPADKVAPTWFTGDTSAELELVAEKTIAQTFLNKARQASGRAIIADRISGVKTYRDVVIATMILRKKLKQYAGATMGIMLPPSVSASITYLATLFTGKTPVMLNWTVGPAHMQHCLETAEVTYVITAKALMDKLQDQGVDLSSLNVKWVYLEELRDQIGLSDKLRALVAGYLSWSSLYRAKISKHAAILFTSGSEAKPKAVPLSHDNILANLSDFNGVLTFKEDDRLVGMLPPFHSLGLAGNIIMPLCLGLKTVYHTNPTESGIIANLVERYRATLLIGTPTFVNGILKSARSEQLASLRLLFTGAEKCPKNVYELTAQRVPGAIVCEGYGITECSPVVSVNSPVAPVAETIGRVLPGMEYVIVHPETFEKLNNDQQGLLLVRGKNIFSGYLGEDVASPFVNYDGRQWYNTGDLVSAEDSGILTFCGRRKRFIKLGGEMISLPAIEAALQQYIPDSDDGTPAMAISATADESYPEVVLFSTINLSREEVNMFLRKAGFSALHNIRKVVNLETIPVLGSGKIDYQKLNNTMV